MGLKGLLLEIFYYTYDFKSHFCDLGEKEGKGRCKVKKSSSGEGSNKDVIRINKKRRKEAKKENQELESKN